MRSPLFLLGFSLVAVVAAPQPAQAHHVDYRDDRPFIRLEAIGRICFAQKTPPVTLRRVPASSATAFPNDAAVALIEEGHLQLALDMVERFPAGSYERFDISRSVAIALAQTDQPIQALKVLARVEGEDAIGERLDSAAFPTVFALVEAGQTDAALEAAALIEDDNHHGEAIAKITTHLVELGEVEQAIALAESVEASFYRTAALACTGVALSDQGDSEASDRVFQQATRLAQQTFYQATETEAIFAAGESIGAVVLGLVESGELNQPIQVLDSLQPVAPRAVLALPLGRAMLLSASLQRVQETLGVEAAYQFLTATTQSPAWSELELPAAVGFVAYQDLSYQQHLNLLEQLETLGDSLDNSTRSTVLSFAAVESAEQQNFEQAVAAFRESIDRLEGDSGDKYGIWRTQNFLAIAQEMILAGDTEAAWQFMDEYTFEPGVEITNLGLITGLGCSESDWLCPRSLQWINREDPSNLGWLDFYYILALNHEIPTTSLADGESFLPGESFDTFAKLYVLTETIETLVISEQYDEAISIAREAQSISQTLGENIENWALSKIVLPFSETAKFETAIAFAEQMQGDSQVRVLLAVIFDLMQAGDYAKAFEIAQQMTLENEGGVTLELSYLLAELANRLAQEDQFERALETSARITSDYNRDITLKAIAAAMAEAGQYEQALELTNQIDASDQKIGALNSIAIALIKSDQIDRGLTVLDQAFALEQGR